MDYDRAIQQLAAYLNLSDEAISVAEGWSILPTDAQRHVTLLINDYIAKIIPSVADLYSAASRPDQIRMNRILERIQEKKRRNS